MRKATKLSQKKEISLNAKELRLIQAFIEREKEIFDLLKSEEKKKPKIKTAIRLLNSIDAKVSI